MVSRSLATAMVKQSDLIGTCSFAARLVNSDEVWLTCPDGQLTVPQSRLAILLHEDILKPENKRSLEKQPAKWAHWSQISAVRV